MLLSGRRALALLVAGSCVATSVTGCSSAVGGRGSASGVRTGTAASGTASHDFPAGRPSGSAPQSGAAGSSAAGGAPSQAAPSQAAPSVALPPAPKAILVTGTSTGTRYVVHVYASDTITDCAAHAYGAAMIAFLRAHRCRPTHRVLATVDDGGRTAVVSLISTSFAGTAADPYATVGKFRQLEAADGTGSIDDLLREGRHVDGIASRIPAREAFQVVGQDQGVVVFDAWWAAGPTIDQEPALLHLEQDLFLTPLMSA